MNALLNLYPNRPADATPSLFPSHPWSIQTGSSQTGSVSSVADRPERKRAALSAGQLLDIELGLFLLSQLAPTAAPDLLPSLLSDNGASFLNRPTWTPRQHKLLNRGRTMLSHILHRPVWSALLDAYVTIPDRLQAYDISTDRSRFQEKTVGFFRNRVITLRQTIG